MNSEKTGTNLKKNTWIKTSERRIWLLKLGVALVVSNIFFFLLFSGSSEVEQASSIPQGWVEVQLEADLLTPFHSGKKVLVVHRFAGKKIEGVLQASGTDDKGRITVLVKEEEAHSLFHHDSWEVLPYLQHLTFAQSKRESHEIRY